MDTNHTIPVYICSLCSKPFTQGGPHCQDPQASRYLTWLSERQHRRHQSYCRKSQNRTRTRPRSCRACNQAKIKCNFRAPCHQCTRKGVACVYEQQRRERVVNRDSAVFDSSRGSTDESVPPSSSVLVEYHSLNFDQLSDIHDNNDFSISAMTNPIPTKSTAILKSPTRTPSLPSSEEMNNWMSSLQPTDFDFSIPDFSPEKAVDVVFPMEPLLPPTILCSQVSTEVAHFSRNKIITPMQQIFSSMVTDMIRAYPLMMTRRETLPPFVHPCCYLHDRSDSLPEALTNCMGIAQLFVHRTDDTRPFVWATIRAEVRDLVQKVRFLLLLDN